jgi:1,4-alpha-glucan branching enzyme
MATAAATQVVSVSSTHDGMGATTYKGGTCFRVWAPFARSVNVAGDFNNFSATSLPLFSEHNGYWAADLDGVGEGAQYKFVIATQGGDILWKNDPYARSLKTKDGHQNSVIAKFDFDWSGSNHYSTPSWNEMVIYELHIGTFNFDKEDSGKKRGTFESVIARLDYLQDLGVNAIEVMAAGEFPHEISWGYNPANIFAIEESYGGPNGFRELVDECHKRNMALLLDVVYNHLGPDDLDLWTFDGWSENNGGGIYFYNDWRAATPWGHTRPDYGRPEVRQYLRDNALRWLESRYVDGLRWDATGYIRNVDGGGDPGKDLPDGWSLFQRIHNEIEQRQPWKISIAEDMQQNEWVTKSVTDGGAGFDSQWDANFVHTIRRNVIAANDGWRNMYEVAQAIGHRFNSNSFERVIFTESHDAVANGQARVPEEIWPGNADSYHSQKRSTLGAGLVFSAPGIPMIFQGQEFLQHGWFDDKKELDWSTSKKFSKITDLYRDLIKLRRDWYGTTRGLKGQHTNVFHINDSDKLLAFHRWEYGGPGDDVVIVANFSATAYESYTLGFPQEGLWKLRLNTDWSGYSNLFGNHHAYDTHAFSAPKDGLSYSANVGIGPYTMLIFSQ